jgi:uncharacterized protein YjbI with pentapeptide repeats
MNGCRLIDVIFDSCKIVGLDFNLCHKHLLKLHFKDSILNTCNFSHLNLIKTNFINCKIHEGLFEESNLQEACFDECDLTDSIFNRSNLSKADFRSAKNYTIDPSNNHIKKAKFSIPEVIGLVRFYDIEIN